MGPLCGTFDQRAAERLIHHCDAMGFDAISGGGTLAWLDRFGKDKIEAAREFWYEALKGIYESLRKFF